ncbi:MAG: amino acid adenylation domain-containing protein, partial [Gemmatimonadales bacterium]|nr:amino acid adenylation domain-containing protein [Gemmatimonadales bacterium]
MHDPEPLGCGTDLAYVMYTSGSTGRPKGVMIERRTVANFLASMRERPGMDASDRLVAVTTPSFDISVLELMLPLQVGATIVIATDAEATDGEALGALLDASDATVLQATPSTWRLLFETGWRGSRRLRALVGGEPLAPDLARELSARTGEAWNLYGPTETTVYSTCWRVPENPGTISIGRPIDNTIVEVVDASGRPAPIGVPGEILIGGKGVARGYHGRPELTAERFITDREGRRMYRTGDLGRWRDDGTLEHLGRLDFQVKIRGHRIELGEIESALLRQPTVTACAVIARADDPADPRLVAYLVGDHLPSSAVLREALKSLLPSFMVPSAFVPLDVLPVLPNGKLDRHALPAPATPESGDPAAIAEPLGAHETAIAAIWAEMIGIARIGRHDDFFELGGHSLLAARVCARVSTHLGRKIPTRTIFDSPVLAQFAARTATPPANAFDIAMQRPANTARDDAGEEHILPATSAQQALWYVESLTGARSSYHIAQSILLEGPVDESALARALEFVASRHDVLRARFIERDTELRVAVRETLSSPLVVMPVAGDPLEEANRFAQAPFDLGQAPLWRAGLLSGPGDTRRLVLVLHHIIADGWSLGVLAREIGMAYSALRLSGEPDLPPLPASYADYLDWHGRQAGSAQAASSLAYWRDRLAGLEPIDLPLDHPRPARRSFAGSQIRTRIDAPRLAGLNEVARRHRATLFMVLLAAWNTVLSRHSGQVDIAVGTPVAGRWQPEFEPLVGYFANMVVMRSDLSGDPTFGELLDRVRSDTLDSLEHQQLPFDQLVTELKPSREAGINPLFQVSFAMQNAPAVPLEMAGVRCQAEQLGARQVKFDLALSISEREGELVAVLEYATELFDAPRIERIVRHLIRVIDQVIADDQVRLAGIELLDAAEREQLRVWAQGPRNPYPADLSLAAVFEAQARRSPQAIALECGDSRLSYAELNARANRVAHALRERSIGPGSLVALCAARGQALLVALLGIVKSGAAYLPLDPQYPAARLRLMVDDARPALTLHDDSIGAEVLSVVAQAGLETLHLADDAPDFRHRPAYDPQPHGSGGDLAYVMYTSGSTGRPKGVMVNHRAVARLVLDTDYVELGADDAVAQVASVSFDAATFEIWGAWLNGARLVVLPPDVALSTPRLGAAIREHSITTMFLTTALFNAHAAGDPAIFAPLRTLVFGGEAADPVSITRVLESGAAPARLVNGYGPTETTTFATTWRVPADPAAHAGETTLGVPIGRPIANTSCHVLDASGRPQPIGVAGELHVGGPGVARGYLGREDLNAERFVADPFEPDGGMLYRTGDLVRWRDDGTLLYVGRNDQQVKIRGFRIELGEVEKALRDCTGVREAAVVADDHPRIGKRLVGFVIPTHECDTAAWRAELRARLPEYMVPALLEEIDVLPITANGKLDRTVLIAHLRNRTSGATAIDPSARRSTSRGGDSLARPLDETTTRLLAIWRRILDRPSLDADAHFFEVGGHSLLALRMLAEVEREFGIELRVAALFEVPTARLFAGLLRDRPASAGTGCAVTIQGGGPT